MMLSYALQPFASTLQKSDRWLQQLMDELGSDDPYSAVRVLRAVLHTLRDRLLPEEAVHLSAQMPALIRGIFFENWTPDRTPLRIRERGEFLDWVTQYLMPEADPSAPEAVAAVFQLLENHITRGELRDVRQMLPPPILDLWPQAITPHRTALQQEGMYTA